MIAQACCTDCAYQATCSQLLETKSFIPEFVVLTRTTQSDRPSIRRSALKSMLGFTKMNIHDRICLSVIADEIVLRG